jgi:hypothetical protein
VLSIAREHFELVNLINQTGAIAGIQQMRRKKSEHFWKTRRAHDVAGASRRAKVSQRSPVKNRIDMQRALA